MVMIITVQAAPAFSLPFVVFIVMAKLRNELSMSRKIVSHPLRCFNISCETNVLTNATRGYSALEAERRQSIPCRQARLLVLFRFAQQTKRQMYDLIGSLERKLKYSIGVTGESITRINNTRRKYSYGNLEVE